MEEYYVTSMAPVLRMYKFKGGVSLASSLELFRTKASEEQVCDTFCAGVLLLEKEPTMIHNRATVLSYFLLGAIK